MPLFIEVNHGRKPKTINMDQVQWFRAAQADENSGQAGTFILFAGRAQPILVQTEYSAIIDRITLALRMNGGR